MHTMERSNTTINQTEASNGMTPWRHDAMVNSNRAMVKSDGKPEAKATASKEAPWSVSQ
jgi:hypothetical protein